MSGLEKAKLWELAADAKGTTRGNPIDVQFNPTSLRLQMTNSVDGGRSRGRQVQQYNGSSSTVLSLDLVFDSADEGDTNHAKDVREKTNDVRRFVLPAEGAKQAPPRVRFSWGKFVFDGVMTGLTEDIDLFSSAGVPLRSKLTVSIQEQDARFAALAAGPGANKGSSTKPGGQNGGPGSSGGGATNRTAPALAGESAADFAARMGLDPTAWRGVAAGLDASLSLQAGIEIDFDANLSAGIGLGMSVGIEAGVSASLEASLGLEAGSGASLSVQGTPTRTSAGLALAAAGGVAAAVETSGVVKTEVAAAQARASFGTPPPAPGTSSLPPAAAVAVAKGRAEIPTGPGLPEQRRSPLRGTGLPSYGAQAAAPSAPTPPATDPREASFGFGVPLRPMVAGAAADRQGAVDGRVVIESRARRAGPPSTPDPSAAPWRALPVAHVARDIADRAQRRRRPGHPCGCDRIPQTTPCRVCGDAP